MSRIDLHTHSTASDGTNSPGELIDLAHATGLTTIALTDHDTFAGWPAALAVAEGYDMEFVPGVEMSCASDQGVSMHMLGLLIDASHAPLTEAISLSRDDRIPRMKKLISNLRAAGMDVSFSELLANVGEEVTIGRPHLADLMVNKGIVRDRDQAFAEYLHNDSPYYVGHYAIDGTLAVQLIKASGGISIFAHPGAYLRGEVVTFDYIAELAHHGLDALEVDHRDHDADMRKQLRNLANELDLLVTGASDFHGTGKLNQLGENLTDPAVWQELRSRANRVA